MGKVMHKTLLGGITTTSNPDGTGWLHLGTVTVEPPLHVGPEFVPIILGRDAVGVQLGEVISDDERTIFLARVALIEGYDSRHDLMHTIVERIGRLANAPLQATNMLLEDPFKA